MKYKVHWIIDGIVDIEAESQKDAEQQIQKDLQSYVKNSKQLMNKFVAKSIQGQAYLPGSSEKEKSEEKIHSGKEEKFEVSSCDEVVKKLCFMIFPKDFLWKT